MSLRPMLTAESIADALARAAERARQEFRDLPDFSLTDAWLEAMVRPVAYAAPTAPDAQGFVTIGEIVNQPWLRTGFVLINPATAEERLVWPEV